MASGGGLMMKKELGETHDVLHFGANDSVRGDLAPAHPVQATIHKEAKFWDEKKFGTEAIYGSAFNIRRDLDAQILSRAMKFTGTTPSRVKKIHFQWSQYSLEFHFDDCQGQAHQRMDCGSMSKGTILDRQMSGLLLMQLLLLLINLSFHSLLLG
ncbi:cyclin-B1-2-like [Triticum urartu]|uniref:cyclin-B1-2-like n=1 Tax=Triticum urartu TaxID=4572 RepID=UPI002043C52E|nr:cyclin-B1-2-like [Triticum urartu]